MSASKRCAPFVMFTMLKSELEIILLSVDSLDSEKQLINIPRAEGTRKRPD
jgi:hypothetical protein